MSGRIAAIAPTASGSGLIATRSTYCRLASISARRFSGKAGRPGPLLTKRSAVTVTTSTSPSSRAACMCRTWPTCRRSKAPCACTTRLPAARMRWTATAASCTLMIFWRGLGASCQGVSGSFQPNRASGTTFGSVTLHPLVHLGRPLGQAAEPVRRRRRDPLRRPYRRIAPLVDVLAHDADTLGKGDPRRPAEMGADLADVREGAVGLARPLRDRDRRRRTEQTDQLVDAHRPAAADVVDFADLVALGDREQRIDDVAHEGEVAGLLAVAHDRERLAGHELGEKDAEHRAVAAARPCARPIHVEQAPRRGWQPIDARPVHDELLAEIFCQRIGVARIGRGRFGRRIPLGNAVAGGRRHIDEAPDRMRAGGLEDVERALDIGAIIGLGLLDRGNDVGAGREVKDALGTRTGAQHGALVGDVALDDVEPGIAVMLT